jgi:type II secretory pathway component HofQ
VGVKKDLWELQDLAQEIKRRLEGDRALYMRDAPSLRKLKEAVYEVEDAVDEFQLKVQKYEADGDGGFVSKYLHTKPKSFVFQCQAAKRSRKLRNV